METMLIKRAIIGFCIILAAKSQENAGSSVAKSLMECYNKTENLDRELRPPSTMNVLIEILRKIESGQSMQNSRLFSKEIIHRFKQDGVVTFQQSGNSNPYVVPYTPKGFQSDKYKIFLKQLVPGNAVNFPNDTLNETEKCSLHFMISNSIDLRKRSDEGTVCSRLERYQRRIRNVVKDVELFKTPQHLKENVQEGENEVDREPAGEEVDEQVDTVKLRSFSDNDRTTIVFEPSDCPVENGAVYTKTETIQAGTMLAGIAAGLEPQSIKVQENYVVNNIFGATLAGDLAEVTLHQGSRSNDKSLKVGASGDWNQTQVPKWYFIRAPFGNEMTDAEIRGGIDGLIMGTKIKEWQSRFSSLKLSQLLDMYYSPRGVFSKKYRACNRKELFTEVASEETLLEQTVAFSFLLDGEAKLFASMTSQGIKTFSEEAVKALINYIPSNLKQVSCITAEKNIERAYTDIIIVIDTRWPFNTVQRAVAHLLDNIDVNKYDSNFTLIDGFDGFPIINSTNSILDFYALYNSSTHLRSGNSGFNVGTAFSVVETSIKQKLEESRFTKQAGGPSLIALFIPYNPPEVSDSSAASDGKEYLRKSVPDLKLLVLGRGEKESYASFVINPTSDAFSLIESTENLAIPNSINPVIARIKEVHRRIINPHCGSTFSGPKSSDRYEDYVEPNSTNYYRIAPNYFFGSGEKSVKVKGTGQGALKICFSKSTEKPDQNSNDCDTIAASAEKAYSLSNLCNTYDDVTQCPPAYLSISAVSSTESTSGSMRCNEERCRFPDNVKFIIHAENFECSSRAHNVVASILVITIMTMKLFFNSVHAL